MVRQGILNLKKGYEFDPIWSRFNPDIRNVIEKKIKFTKRWLWLSFWNQFFHLFSVTVFCFWRDFILGDWWVCQCVHMHMWQLSFQFCIFIFCVWNGSMMKPTWMLSWVGSLKKAPLSAEMLEKRCLTELNIVNNHHSKNKESGVGKAKAKKRKLELLTYWILLKKPYNMMKTTSKQWIPHCISVETGKMQKYKDKEQSFFFLCIRKKCAVTSIRFQCWNSKQMGMLVWIAKVDVFRPRLFYWKHCYFSVAMHICSMLKKVYSLKSLL